MYSINPDLMHLIVPSKLIYVIPSLLEYLCQMPTINQRNVTWSRDCMHSITPLVSHLYFWDHTKSLEDPCIDTIAYTGLSLRRRCLVQPEEEMSPTVGDGDVLYGWRGWCLVWPETVMSHMAGDDCWLWYELMAFSCTGTFIYILALWPT